VPPSNANSSPGHKLRAALTLLKLSVPKIAKRHKVPAPTLYAVLRGARPGKNKRVRSAIAEMEALAQEAFRNVA
jgi:predicted transcriptional regulator